jgi:LmbE family N-acetylglucosaminyl deacetylase
MLPERALVIAAHPDDEVLGCGGTIARYRMSGVDVRVVFLAEGVTARYADDELNSQEVIAKSENRNRNAIKALNILSVPQDQVFLSTRPCCRLDQVPLIHLVKEIEQHLNEIRPDQVLCHSAGDVNIDHRIANEALRAAIRPSPGSSIRSVLNFEVLSSTEWNTDSPFAPTTFVDISEVMDLKVEALAAYGDEMRPAPHPRSPEVLRALATFRGTQVGVRYAEGFSVFRTLV